MENWIEIMSFTLPQDAYFVKGRLESDGIEIILKDELTTQVYNFYSNAIGGVKLLVKESDYERAYAILVESKYIKVEEHKPNKFVVNFDKFSARLPVIGKLGLDLRLLVVIAILLAVIILIIAVLTLPSNFERLTKNNWYIEKIYFNGKEIKPKSDELTFVANNNAYATISFRENGEVEFPGINSYSIQDKWELKDDSIIVKPDKNITNNSDSDLNRNNINSFYEGRYKLEISDNFFKMKSSNILIIGRIY